MMMMMVVVVSFFFYATQGSTHYRTPTELSRAHASVAVVAPNALRARLTRLPFRDLSFFPGHVS